MSPIKNLKFSSPYEERELERELRVFERVLLVVAFSGVKISAPPQVRAFLGFWRCAAVVRCVADRQSATARFGGLASPLAASYGFCG